MTAASHHVPGGGFRNPWPTAEGDRHTFADALRWQWQRLRHGVPPNPPSALLPLAPGAVVHPRNAAADLHVTWVGHATFLVQVGGWNVLTDPIWSERASPVQWAGPTRLVPPGLRLEELPPVDAIVLSHDHYDHLDAPTVDRLRDRFGTALRWITPLGYRDWFRSRRVEVTELDWWDRVVLEDGGRRLEIHAAPAQHWTRRTPLQQFDRLWASFALLAGCGARVFFGGDTGYFPGFPEIRERFGPFDALLLPIGAYEPRWFMRAVHMNPEEAVRAYGELGGGGVLVPMHWGTFRMTDEDVLEPPRRLQEAAARATLRPENVALLRHGETARVPVAARAGDRGKDGPAPVSGA
ncbi:MAG TPA: MBL fold metallo-hydrolase [Longimicrobiales bacterium]|nr:MBL fold metallo-hydrolase [Longimicrobiales bacterium]